jgi:hypothetical protein
MKDSQHPAPNDPLRKQSLIAKSMTRPSIQTKAKHHTVATQEMILCCPFGDLTGLLKFLFLKGNLKKIG